MSIDYDEAIIKISELLDKKEHYQRTLGKIASEVAQDWGSDKLKELAEDIKETHGLHITYNSLRNYRYVYDNTKDLELPEDLSYRTLQYIASSGRPAFWALRIKKEGLSSAEVYHILRVEKGYDQDRIDREIVCPSCGKLISVPE